MMFSCGSWLKINSMDIRTATFLAKLYAFELQMNISAEAGREG
jgi:hypothetical protein